MIFAVFAFKQTDFCLANDVFEGSDPSLKSSAVVYLYSA